MKLKKLKIVFFALAFSIFAQSIAVVGEELKIGEPIGLYKNVYDANYAG